MYHAESSPETRIAHFMSLCPQCSDPDRSSLGDARVAQHLSISSLTDSKHRHIILYQKPMRNIDGAGANQQGTQETRDEETIDR